MVQFLDPKIAKIPQFLDPEIVKMDKKIYGSGNRRNGAISGSRNRRKGRQILYQEDIDMYSNNTSKTKHHIFDELIDLPRNFTPDMERYQGSVNKPNLQQLS